MTKERMRFECETCGNRFWTLVETIPELIAITCPKCKSDKVKRRFAKPKP